MTLIRSAGFAAAALALALAGPTTVLAQTQVFARCSKTVTPMAGLRFDNAEHKAWYLRFWTGSCAGTHSFCMSGSPDWLTTIAYVQSHAAPADREALTDRACRLGQQIGMEWSRDPAIKKIKVNDLRTFQSMLSQNPNLSVALDKITAKVAELMTTRRAA